MAKESTTQNQMNDLLFVNENDRDTQSYTTTKALTNYPINSATKRAVVFATTELALSRFRNMKASNRF